VIIFAEPAALGMTLLRFGSHSSRTKEYAPGARLARLVLPSLATVLEGM